MTVSGLYLVTNQDLLTKNSAISLPQGIQAALAGGVNVVQMREPLLPLKEFYEVAKFGTEVAKAKGVPFLINDRVDVMQAVDADGVHIGWRSLPVEVVRKLTGDSKIIGVSTHNMRECRAAQENGADYVTLGPVFSTPSKYGILDPIGLETLKKIRDSLRIPVIAIGGITPELVPEVMATGVTGVAIMSGIMAAEDVKAATLAYARQIAV